MPAGIGGATGPIGFHLAKDRLHMVQLERHDGGFRLRSGLSVPYPSDRESLLSSPNDFKSFVKKILKTGQFKSNEIVTCLPGGVKIINLSYRIEPGQKIEDEIVKSIIYSLGGAPEDYVIDYLPIRSENLTNRDKSVLAIVAPRQKIIKFLELLDAAGLQVQAIDAGPSSLGRLVASLDREKSYPNTLLINFAENKSYLSVFDGRRLIMDRAVSLGVKDLAGTLAASLGIDRDQAVEMLNRYGFETMARSEDDKTTEVNNKEIVDSIVEIVKPYFHEISDEVNKMLLFTKSETRGKTIDHIYLLGSLARFPGADRFISKIFSFPVSVLDPLAHIVPGNGHMERINIEGPAQVALSVGFALRGLI